jgi:hypothetical protein
MRRLRLRRTDCGDVNFAGVLQRILLVARSCSGRARRSAHLTTPDRCMVVTPTMRHASGCTNQVPCLPVGPGRQSSAWGANADVIKSVDTALLLRLIRMSL